MCSKESSEYNLLFVFTFFLLVCHDVKFDKDLILDISMFSFDNISANVTSRTVLFLQHMYFHLYSIAYM